MATYLVTGAAGFIGSKVCEALLATGHGVVGIDNLNNYYDVRLKDYRLGLLLGIDRAYEKTDGTRSHFDRDARLCKGKFVFQRIDIEDQAAIRALFKEFSFDAVFNLGARAGVRYSMVDPHVYLRTNVGGTLNLLEAMREHGVKKMVLSSTSSLYANGVEESAVEGGPERPLSPYAVSKKAAEQMGHCYNHLYQTDVTVVRYFTVFGPAGRPDMCIFRFIKWIDEGKPLTLYGDGSQARDFTYVNDIVAGTIAALSVKGYEIINLGGGRDPITLSEIISRLESALGKKAKIVQEPFMKADVLRTSADISKAHRLLSWQPQVCMVEGLSACIDWYLANRSWVADVKL